MREIIATWFTSLLVFFQLNPVGSATVQSDDFGRVEIFQHATTEDQSYVLIVRDQLKDGPAFTRLAREMARESVTVIGIDLAQSHFNFESADGRGKFGTKLIRLAEAVEKSLGETRFSPPDVIFLNDRKALSLDLRFSSIAGELGLVQTLGVCPGLRHSDFINEEDAGSVVEDHFVEAYVPADQPCDRVAEFKRSVLVHSVAYHNFDPYLASTWPRELSGRFRIHSDARSTATGPRLIDRSPEELFPLVALVPEKIESDHFVILLSGDGGWADFTQDLAGEYTRRGIPVIGLNSLLYFWKQRTPAEVTRDLGQIASFYQNKFGLRTYDLVGYSFGGSLIPMVVAHMDAKAKKNLNSAVMLAPGLTSKLEFEVSDWLQNSESGRPIEDDLKNARGMQFKCLQGVKDGPGICLHLAPIYGRSYILDGGHHFGYKFPQFEGILF